MSMIGAVQKLQRNTSAHQLHLYLHLQLHLQLQALRRPAQRLYLTTASSTNPPPSPSVFPARKPPRTVIVAPEFAVLEFTPEHFCKDKRPPQRILKKLPYTSLHRRNNLHHHSHLLYQTDPSPPPVDPRDTPPQLKKHNYLRPMLTYAQVVSVPTADTPAALVMLHFEDRRYAFGQIAEGSQRLCNQRKIGLAKLDELFISGPVAWSSVGGLMGLILTIADIVGTQKANGQNNKKTIPPSSRKSKASREKAPMATLKIHGGENITHMIATTRRFIFRKGLPLRLHEFVHKSATTDSQSRKPDFEDANIRVWYLSLLPEDANPVQGRKRSHEDMEKDGDGQDSQPTSHGETKSLVQSVVDQMFDSNWNLDAMIETTLHQAQQGATIFVRKDGKLVKYDGPMPGSGGEVEDIPVLVRTPWPAGKITTLPTTKPSKQSMSYIAKSHPRRGKFNVVEATKLGVRKDDFKHLAAGKTVKGKDDMDVTPEMCVEPTIDGRGLAFIDLPDPSYVEALVARSEWADEAITGTVDVIYWNLGRGVVHDDRLQKFMKDRQSIHHVVFAPEPCPNRIALESPAMQMQKLHMVDPDRFPLPTFDNEARYSFPDKTFTQARPMFMQRMAPRRDLVEDDIVPFLDPKQVSLDDRITEMAQKAQERSTDPHFLADIKAREADIPARDTEVIALGTGSSLPSKHRNVSATLVRVPGCGSYLFDAGEGTLGQLRRMYGMATTDVILADLKVIWISHMHADHHLGTASIIKAWRDVTADPTIPPAQQPRLFVASNPNMLDWLREYSEVEDYGYSRIRPITISGVDAREALQNPFIFNDKLSREAGGLSRIEACRVDHCSGAYACVFTWEGSGLRVAYSGDCRPSRAFAAMAHDATLLIHEATLDDELRGDALVKKHCTMSEALGVARQMRARRVLLTHFSQRYPGIPAQLVEQREEDDRDLVDGQVDDQVVLIAFDQMHVRLGDFKKAQLFLPTLRALLSASASEAEDGDL